MAQNEDRTYPHFHKLCYEKNVNGVINLLKSVSDVNKKDPDGRTPLMYVFCLYRGVENDVKNINHKLAKLTNLLLNKGANINESDKDGCTVFHPLARVTPFVKNDKILVEPVRVLLENGGNSNIKNCKGLTASKIAYYNGSIKIGDMLQISEMQRRFYSNKNDNQPPSYDDATTQTKSRNEKPDEVSAKSSSRENEEVSSSEQGEKEEMVKNLKEKQHITRSFDDSGNETTQEDDKPCEVSPNSTLVESKEKHLSEEGHKEKPNIAQSIEEEKRSSVSRVSSNEDDLKDEPVKEKSGDE